MAESKRLLVRQTIPAMLLELALYLARVQAVVSHSPGGMAIITEGGLFEKHKTDRYNAKLLARAMKLFILLTLARELLMLLAVVISYCC